MSRASTPTLLSLEKFAKIMGINPVHFSGAWADTNYPFIGSCNEVWPQYSWQSDDLVSREDLAQQIAIAERDITYLLGFPPSPTWVEEDVYSWPRITRNSGLVLSPEFKLKHGKVIAGGRKSTVEIETSVIPVYSDADGDGFFETATITITSDAPVNEIRVFFAGRNANPSWEIRPAKSRSSSGGTVTLTFNSWLFIDSDLWEEPVNVTENGAIDITTTANYVTEVDVYRIYNDTTEVSCRYYWKGYSSCPYCGTAGCEACSDHTQGGCMIIDDSKLGIVRPMPAEYSDTDENWQFSSFCVPGIPTSVMYWYYSGIISPEYAGGWDDEPMPILIAEAVATLAASRLEKPFCSCGNIQERINRLRRDMLYGGRTEGFFVIRDGDSSTSSPLGTKYGEVMVWRKLQSMVPETVWEAGVL